jgi:aminoglycoside phosphotransferase (APT) family kinase protein
VVKQARARLAVQMEWLADVRRVVREAEAMEWLRERLGGPHIPRLLHLDRERNLLVMEAVPAAAENYKSILLRGEVDLALAEQFGWLLARIHNATADLETHRRFGDATFFDELRLSPYYDTAAARHPDLAPRIRELRRECRESTFCLVHGDYSPKNVLVLHGRLILLDYEVAHFGNPSFDLGFALTHFLAKALHVPGRGPAFIAAARRFWETWRRDSRIAPEATAHAGQHLGAVLLARMDGKSPLEYFTDPAKKDVVRAIARRALTDERMDIPAVIAEVEDNLE